MCIVLYLGEIVGKPADEAGCHGVIDKRVTLE